MVKNAKKCQNHCTLQCTTQILIRTCRNYPHYKIEGGGGGRLQYSLRCIATQFYIKHNILQDHRFCSLTEFLLFLANNSNFPQTILTKGRRRRRSFSSSIGKLILQYVLCDHVIFNRYCYSFESPCNNTTRTLFVCKRIFFRNGTRTLELWWQWTARLEMIFTSHHSLYTIVHIALFFFSLTKCTEAESK